MAKLCTDVAPSDVASPSMEWLEAEAMDRPHRGPHGAGARRGAASDDRRLDDPWEDVHGKHPRISVHLPDTVLGTELKQGGWTMERRSSPVWSMVSELNGGEGAGPLGQGAALGSGKALGHAHGERGGVRWLDTDEVAENRGKRGGDRLPGADTVLMRTRCRGWPSFIVVHCLEATWAAPGERKGGDGSAVE
jgi:hypothetical protein